MKQVSAQLVLIVEKEALVQVLLSDPGWQDMDIALLTARGYPDYSARAMVTQLADSVPVFYLGDHDPYGADILLEYALGSPGTAG